MTEKPNLFFILNTGEAVRNFARFGVLEAVAKRGFRSVLFGVKEALRASYKTTLGDDVIFEEFGEAPWRGKVASTQRLVTYSWRTRISYGDVLVRHGAEKKWTHPIQHAMGYLLRPMPYTYWDSVYVKNSHWPRAEELFAKYKPKAVMISNPVAAENSAINEAKRRGIYTACLLESWDNLTIRGGLYSYPDNLLVWNKMMVRQAIEQHRFPEDRVEAIGIPSFDIYQHTELVPTEAEWRRQLGIPEGKRVIVYSTSSQFRSNDEFEVIDLITKAADEGRLPDDIHVIVRISPRDDPKVYDRYTGSKRVTVQSPQCSVENHDPSYGRCIMLAATMRYASVVVNIFSTMVLDAFANGAPVVAIAFDPSPRTESRSVRRYLRDEHVKDLVAYDAVSIANNSQELLQHIDTHLKDRNHNLANRERCTLDHMTSLDGKRADYFADLLVKRLKERGSI